MSERRRFGAAEGIAPVLLGVLLAGCGPVAGLGTLGVIAASGGGGGGGSDHVNELPFTEAQALEASPGKELLTVEIADLDGDGQGEVILAERRTSSGPPESLVEVYSLAGAVLTKRLALPVATPDPFIVASGDFNLDGRTDIVLADRDATGGIEVLRTDASSPLTLTALPRVSVTDLRALAVTAMAPQSSSSTSRSGGFPCRSRRERISTGIEPSWGRSRRRSRRWLSTLRSFPKRRRLRTWTGMDAAISWTSSSAACA